MSHLKKIIYNCKQATFLIEKKAITRLSFREVIELRIHLYGCSFCKLYSKQSRIINEMVQELFRSSMHSELKLDEDFKKELQERIEEELNKN
jgi:DNA polymerase III delta prime subunit